MGEQGARFSEDVGAIAESLVESWQPLGEVTWKKMFGGAGVFVDRAMFALIDSAGTVHLKADESNEVELEELGGVRHGRMPYVSVTDDVLADDDRLLGLATQAASVARGA